MLAAAMGLKPTAAQGRFADVPGDYWGAGWIEAAASQGLVEGGDQGFQPDTELTREQMMAMLIRAVSKEKEASQMTESLSFADAKEISGWAQGYAVLAVKLGFVEGSADGIRPQATSTRAEAAMVIYRLLIKQDKL
ncbi:Endoglucanase precursor [compost metagenome]